MLPEADSSLQELLESRRALGFDDVPVSSSLKAPSVKGWPNIERFDWPAFVDKNIGCRGTWVVPVDIDESVTAQIALRVFDALLDDALVYDGRPSRPISHFYFNVPDGAPRLSRNDSPFRQAYYPAPVGVSAGQYVIELKHHRGLQAVTAPSVHPSGEALVWLKKGVALGERTLPKPPYLSAAHLEQALRCIWLARALVVLWSEGHRHNLCLWAGSWLYSGGLSAEEGSLVWAGLSAVGGAEEFERPFMADWLEESEVFRGTKGVAGVEEIAEHVLGSADAGRWMERVVRIWPCLRRGGAVAAGPVSGLVVQAASRFEAKAAVAQEPAASAPAPAGPVWTEGAEAELRRLQRECTLILADRGEGQVHDLRDGSMVSVRSYKQGMGRVGQEWMGSRGGAHFIHVVDTWLERTDKRVARGTAYMPGHPFGAVVDGVVNTFRRGAVWESVYSRWRAEALEVVEAANLAWWLDWVSRVIPDEGERQRFHQWVAHLLVHPERLPGWALYMMTPVEGVGRTSLARGLQQIMGRENCRAISMEEIKSGYNNWAVDSVFRYANEIRESGESRGTVAARLQDAIADADLGVTRKYAASMTVSNFGGYWLISNSSSDLHLRGMSRRYCCIANGHEKPSSDEISSFNAHLDDTVALEAVCAWYFQLWDAEPSLPPEAPRTTAFHHAVEDSASDSEFLIGEAVVELESSVFTMNQILRWYDGPLVTGNERARQTKMRNMLRAAGFVTARRIRHEKCETRVVCRAVDKAQIESMGLEELTQILDAVELILNRGLSIQ